MHTLAEAFVSKIRDEVAVLSSQVDDTGRLTWSDFETACSRINRRIVLGDQARDDQELTDGAPRGVRART